MDVAELRSSDEVVRGASDLDFVIDVTQTEPRSMSLQVIIYSPFSPVSPCFWTFQVFCFRFILRLITQSLLISTPDMLLLQSEKVRHQRRFGPFFFSVLLVWFPNPLAPGHPDSCQLGIRPGATGQNAGALSLPQIPGGDNLTTTRPLVRLEFPQSHLVLIHPLRRLMVLGKPLFEMYYFNMGIDRKGGGV